MKFDFNLSNGLGEKCLPMLKGQMSTISFGVTYSHCMIRLSICSKYIMNLH